MEEKIAPLMSGTYARLQQQATEDDGGVKACAKGPTRVAGVGVMVPLARVRDVAYP